jgi:transcription initiation factor IIE alpha subunit
MDTHPKQIEETEAFERTLATDRSGKMASCMRRREDQSDHAEYVWRFGMEKVNGG